MAQRSPVAKALLIPLSKLYGAGTWARNKMYDLNLAKQTKFDIPTLFPAIHQEYLFLPDNQDSYLQMAAS